MNPRKRVFVGRAVYYLVGVVFASLVLVAGAIAFAQVELPIDDLYPFSSQFFFAILVGLPYVIGFGGLFAFRKRAYNPSKTFFHNSLPAVVSFLGLLASFVLVQFFFAQKLVPSTKQLEIAKTEQALINLHKEEVLQAKKLREEFKNSPQSAMSELLARATELHQQYPRNLLIERLLLEARASVGLNQPLRRGGKPTTLLRQKSLLERRAVEAQNNQDYMGAALLYKTLISILPGREFLNYRQAYEDRMALCLSLARDPNAHLTEKDFHQQSFNRRLNQVHLVLKAEPLRNAFFAAKGLYLHEPSEEQARELFEELSQRLAREDFFPWEFERFYEGNVPFKRTGAFGLQLRNSTLQARSAIATPNAFFLEEVVLQTPEQTITAPHAKWLSKTLLLQTNASQPAQLVRTEVSSKAILPLVDLLSSRSPLLLLHMGPLHLYRVQASATSLFGHDAIYWKVAFLYQIGLVPFAIFLFLLNSFISLRDQPYPLHPINLLTTFVRNLLWTFIYLLVVFGASLVATLTSHLFLPSGAILLFVVVVVLGTFARIGKISFMQKEAPK